MLFLQISTLLEESLESQRFLYKSTLKSMGKVGASVGVVLKSIGTRSSFACPFGFTTTLTPKWQLSLSMQKPMFVRSIIASSWMREPRIVDLPRFNGGISNY